MHEIAHTDYFRAWTKPKVVYHRACERGNRIIAVVCRDLRRSHKAPSPSTSTYRGNEMKRRILSSFIWVPPTALYLTLDLYESCYGVTWTWGSKETDRQWESGRYWGEKCNCIDQWNSTVWTQPKLIQTHTDGHGGNQIMDWLKHAGQ